MTDNIQNLTILQVVFGTIFIILGMITLTPAFMLSGSIVPLYIIVALVWFRDGLVQLISAVIHLAGKRE
jgi:hypothetical protein